MEIVTLIVSVVALIIAVLAYRRTGGIQDLRRQVSTLGSVTDALRTKTANALDRLEKTVRGSPHASPESLPEEIKEAQ